MVPQIDFDAINFRRMFREKYPRLNTWSCWKVSGYTERVCGARLVYDLDPLHPANHTRTLEGWSTLLWTDYHGGIRKWYYVYCGG